MSNKTIFKNVRLGKNVVIEDFCIIGLPPKGRESGEFETIIEDNAIIRSHTVIYAGNKIGKGFKTGHHVMIRENNQIGNNVSVGTGSCIEHQVKIGDNVRIHSGAFIPEFSLLEDSCWIGPGVVLTNAKYPQSKCVKSNLQGPKVATKAKIGANVTLLPGIEVGANCLIGAGSVVTKNVPAGQIFAGNPAKKISSIEEKNEY